jgi:hypothetical protein
MGFAFNRRLASEAGRLMTPTTKDFLEGRGMFIRHPREHLALGGFFMKPPGGGSRERTEMTDDVPLL